MKNETTRMRKSIALFLVLAGLYSNISAQEIQTVFRNSHSTGGYGALTNRFTHIGGEFANLCGIYGGVYLNHKFMIGLSAIALTNDLEVPSEYSVDPTRHMSYQYGQVGLVTEYVLGSNKAVHVVFDLFSGAGFTLQYERHSDWDDFDSDQDKAYDQNWFFVAEPGVQVEVNLTRWMRFSPGVSYRLAYGSDAAGLTDNDLRDINYNVTLKFGKF
jgi:hypothetical protein